MGDTISERRILTNGLSSPGEKASSLFQTALTLQPTLHISPFESSQLYYYMPHAADNDTAKQEHHLPSTPSYHINNNASGRHQY